jgi:hypothetical protein
MEPHTFTTSLGTSDKSSISYSGLSDYSTGTDFRISSGTTASPNTISFSHPINYTSPSITQIMQNKVAVFHVIRDEDEKIIKTEFIKELWVETKNGQSVDFQVARDKDLAEYEMSDLSIKTILTVSF